MLGRVRSSVRQAVERSTELVPSTSLPELVGLGVAVTAFVSLGGPAGVFVAAALVGVWFVLPVEYVFAAGQVCLLVVAPEPVGLELLLAVEAGLGVLVAGSLREAAASWRPPVVWVLAAVGLGGGVVATAANGTDLWQVALVLWVALAVAAYGLYRHELVTLGLTEGERQL
jgi:hypothetical protein